MVNKEPSLKVRFILYPVVAGLFLIVCTFIVLVAMGYNFKVVNGQIIKEKTGGIIISTRPGDAEVYLNNKIYAKRTPAFNLFSLNVSRLPVGAHNIRIEKEGYETWEGTFNVKSGLVSWGNYILLLPKERKYESYGLANIQQVISSKNGNKLAVLTHDKDSSIAAITEINTQSKQKEKIFEVITAADESYLMRAYSPDNNHLHIVKNLNESQSSLVLETSLGGKVHNLSEKIKVPYRSILFSPTNKNEVYYNEENNLYRLRYTSTDAVPVLVTKDILGHYILNGDLYFTKNTEDIVSLWKVAQKPEIVIKKLPLSSHYQFDFLPEKKSYIVLPLDSKELFLFGADSKKEPIKISGGVDWFRASPSGKYIAFTSEAGLKTYNVSRPKIHDVLDKKITALTWAEDESNIIYRAGDSLNMVNFNGFYNKNITKIEDYTFLISKNYNLYFFGAGPSRETDLWVYSFNL
jgi:hypothetical protein